MDASAFGDAGPAQREVKLIKMVCVATAPLQAVLAFAVLRPGDALGLSMIGWALNAYGVIALLAVCGALSVGAASMVAARRRRAY